MARIFQLDPVVGAVIDPTDQLLVDRSAALARRATQSQVIHAMLKQTYDGGVSFPPGSLGALLLAGGGGGGGTGGGAVSGFASTPGPLVETGVTVVNPVLNWTIAGVTVTAQSLSGPLAVALSAAQRSVTLTGSLTADATWALTVTTSTGSLNASASLLFGHRIHYGRGVAATPSAATILALAGSQLARVPTGTYSIAANDGSNPYWWFCYPDSWGAVTIRDAATGLPVALSDAGTVSVTNAAGHTRAFRCLRSLNALNAAMTIVI